MASLGLGGCMNLSGVGGESRYACKVPDGITCTSVSGTYANRGQNPAAAARTPGPHAPTINVAPRAATPTPSPTSTPGSVGTPLRSSPRILRLWVKPWEDLDGDLYDQSHVYVEVDNGQWQLEHAQRRIRDAYAPLRPPARLTAPREGERSEDTAAPANRPLHGLPSSAASTALGAGAGPSVRPAPHPLRPALLSAPASD